MRRRTLQVHQPDQLICSRGASFPSVRLLRGVQYFAIVIWHGDMALLDPSAIVCRSWHPSEDRELDREDLAVELDLHERGWRMCDCFSRYVPEGEFGHIPERRLYPISRPDFERALELLAEQDLPEYEEHVYNAVARAASLEQTERSAVEPVIVFTPPV